MRQASLILLLLTATSCKEEILHDLTEAQANQVWITLERKQIDVEKKKGINGWGISVEHAHAVKALQLLQQVKLPHGLWREKEAVASSIIPSKEERQLSRERQLASAIEGSLLSLPGILDAHVHLVIPFSDSQSRSTASVLIVSDRPGAIQPQQLRDLVAGATSIQKEFVAVAVVSDEEYLQKTELDLPRGIK